MPPSASAGPTQPASASIELRDVTLQRGVNTIFSGLTLQLNEPRIGLIGDNGAGKTSLFRLLCGLDAAQRGSVIVHGLDARTVSRQRPGLVGMMFQNPDEQIIFPTVAEELALGLSPSGVPRRQALADARVFLASRQLADWSERSIGALSQGQRQHVCWLALLIAAPELLLLDEPFASLDQPGQALLSMDIAKASQRVIVSTHMLEHVRHFERVIWLDHGRVRADGPGPEVCSAYQADVAARIAAQALSHQ